MMYRVYGGQPLPRTFGSRRAARRLMRAYRRLGIQASLYSGTDGAWEIVERRDGRGLPYWQPEDYKDVER